MQCELVGAMLAVQWDSWTGTDGNPHDRLAAKVAAPAAAHHACGLTTCLQAASTRESQKRAQALKQAQGQTRTQDGHVPHDLAVGRRAGGALEQLLIRHTLHAVGRQWHGLRSFETPCRQTAMNNPVMHAWVGAVGASRKECTSTVEACLPCMPSQRLQCAAPHQGASNCNHPSQQQYSTSLTSRLYSSAASATMPAPCSCSGGSAARPAPAAAAWLALPLLLPPLPRALLPGWK